jgi:aspartyl-tRNA(Asn)/glutamyl-tRNA(Gln) amidotransferase subunit A
MAETLLSTVEASGAPMLPALSRALCTGSVTSEALVAAYRSRYEADRSCEYPVNGYVEFFASASEAAREADRLRASGDPRPFLGVPVAIKDNIHIRGEELTCASRILAGYRAPYSATVIERLLAAGFVILGRTNMDEFAMGSSCEYSCYGPSRNPADRKRSCGGSSGGSAAVVAAGQAPIALGSDTGGSVRLPASFCGVYGFKPTYGALSRYGLVAFGSSLDQIGFLASTPADIAALLAITAGIDPRDETSAVWSYEAPATEELSGRHREVLRGRRFGIPEELIGAGMDVEVRAVFDSFVANLEAQGASVERFSLPALEECIAIYYIIAPAEASSNLSRFDGVKYGLREGGSGSLREMYEQTRMSGFGDEVKRRILIGNYVLSSGYYDAYYKKAQAVRRLLREAVDRSFVRYDFLLSPTSPTPAFPLGSRTDDPLEMYLSDVCTTYVNLAGLPALSIPAGRTASLLPVGIQLSAPRFSDGKILAVADAVAAIGSPAGRNSGAFEGGAA